MVDLPGRDEREAALAKRLAREFAAARRVTLEALGDDMNALDLAPEIWAEFEAMFSGAVLPELAATFTAAVDAFAETIGYAFDVEVMNAAAAEWAAGYTYELVTGINATSRARLSQIVSGFFDSGVTLADTRAAVAQLYGPVRAEMIAATEVTRAAVQGERKAAGELEREGVRMRPVWQTNIDDRTCPVCGPLHGKPVLNGVFPPAHPRCRCWVNHEVILDDENTGAGA